MLQLSFSAAAWHVQNHHVHIILQWWTLYLLHKSSERLWKPAGGLELLVANDVRVRTSLGVWGVWLTGEAEIPKFGGEGGSSLFAWCFGMKKGCLGVGNLYFFKFVLFLCGQWFGPVFGKLLIKDSSGGRSGARSGARWGEANSFFFLFIFYDFYFLFLFFCFSL